MFGQFLMILVGISALVGAGAFSYLSFEQAIGLRPSLVSDDTRSADSSADSNVAQEVPIPVVAKKEGARPATSTQIIQKKKIIVREPAPVLPPAKTNGSLVPAVVVTEKPVVAPGPLRASPASSTSSTPSYALSVRGVIDHTNIARAQNGGLPALVENEMLVRDAQMKVDDMFAKQYFEHVSPSGVGPDELAVAAGYAYVVVGENLALGDFASDQALVTAWMNSPGHRANILNTHFQEIGVAVGKGLYEGRETWLAVQSFGMPLSACPEVNAPLKAQIDANNTEIARRRAELDAKKAQMNAIPLTDPNYNVYVGEFNALVPEFNALVEINRATVATYNAGVQSFNACINVEGAH